MIQVLLTAVALGGCALIVGVMPFDEKLPLLFRILIMFCAAVALSSLAYLSIRQAWLWVRACFRCREENTRREEAVPLAGQARPPAALRPPATTRSHSFVYSSASSSPLPEDPPPYESTLSPPRYTSSPVRPHPIPRPIFLPNPPPPFPIPPFPLGFPTQPTAPAYDSNPDLNSLEMALWNCHYYDQAREPLFRESSRPPSPASSRNEVEEHSNSGSDKEDVV